MEINSNVVNNQLTKQYLKLILKINIFSNIYFLIKTQEAIHLSK